MHEDRTSYAHWSEAKLRTYRCVGESVNSGAYLGETVLGGAVLAIDDLLRVAGAVQDGSGALVRDTLGLAPLPQQLHVLALRAGLDVRQLLGLVAKLQGRGEETHAHGCLADA